MTRISFFSSLSPTGKLFLLLGIVFVFAIAISLAGLVAGMLFFNESLSSISALISHPATPKAVAFLKFYQVTNQVGVFILPVLFFSYLVSNNTFEYVSANRLPKLISILLGGMVIYSILPFNNYVDEINRQLNLPDSLSGLQDWMMGKEVMAKKLTTIFLKASTIPGLLVNMLVVAVIPAIGEELLFRGVLLKLLNSILKNIHFAVILSAIIFSAIHIQFYGFLPRFILGLILGYLFVFTGNIWVPIFAHFINNASSVIIFYLHHNGYIKVTMDNFGTSTNTVYVIGSLLITIWLMMMLFQKEGMGRHIKI